MTNSEKFSPEWGFTPGVVVELNTNHFKNIIGTIKEIADGSICVAHRDDMTSWYDLYRIKSVRILSGPWAVWQFAPPGSVGCNIVAYDIVWFTSNDAAMERKWGEGSQGYMPRPWWTMGKEDRR